MQTWNYPTIRRKLSVDKLSKQVYICGNVNKQHDFWSRHSQLEGARLGVRKNLRNSKPTGLETNESGFLLRYKK